MNASKAATPTRAEYLQIGQAIVYEKGIWAVMGRVDDGADVTLLLGTGASLAGVVLGAQVREVTTSRDAEFWAFPLPDEEESNGAL
jgi:hypothetical protein